MKKTKKLLAMLLSICVILAYMPVTAFAAVTTTEAYLLDGPYLYKKIGEDNYEEITNREKNSITTLIITEDADEYKAEELQGLSSLKKITVDENNTHFKLDDSGKVLYTQKSRVLVKTTNDYALENLNAFIENNAIEWIDDYSLENAVCSSDIFTISSTVSNRVAFGDTFVAYRYGDSLTDSEDNDTLYKKLSDAVSEKENYIFLLKDDLSKSPLTISGDIIIDASLQMDSEIYEAYKVCASEINVVSGGSLRIYDGKFNGTFNIDSSAQLKLCGGVFKYKPNNKYVDTDKMLRNTSDTNYPYMVTDKLELGNSEELDYILSYRDTQYIDGKKKYQPSVTIEYDSTMLKQGEDYTVEYLTECLDEDGYNVDGEITSRPEVGHPRECIVHIIATEDSTKCYGEANVYYYVYAKKPLQGAIFETIPAQVYTGKEIKPIPVLTYNGKQIPSSELEYEYYNNVDLCTNCIDHGAYVVVKAKETSTEYEGENWRPFDIIKDRIDIKNATVTVSGGTYTGSAVTPTVSVSYGGTTLTNNKDYTYTVHNNINAGSGAYVTITGMNGYKGTKTQYYSIAGKPLSSAGITATATNEVYTGSYVTPSVTVKDGTKVLTQGVDYTVGSSYNKNVGAATITITGKGNYSGSTTASFYIKYNLANATVTLDKTVLPWTGSAVAPTATVKYDTTVLTAGTDYTVSSTYANKNCGAYTVTLTAPATSTRTTGSTSYTYTINGTDQSVTGVSSSYSKTMATETFKLVPSAVDATGFAFASSNKDVATVTSDGVVTINGLGKTTITINTVGNTKYNPAIKKVTLTVKPKKGVMKSATSTVAGKIKFKYTKQAGGITGAQIRYSKTKDFDTYTTKTFKATNSKATAVTGTKTYSGFKSGKTYYVKVRNYKTLDDGKKIYGLWSKVKKVTVL